MKMYSFQMTQKEVRELCFRVIWEQLLLHRARFLLLLALLALECVLLLHFSWPMAVVLVIFLLLIFAVFIVWKNSVLKKQLCEKTQTIVVENGVLKQNMEGELYREIPCGIITQIRMTRHLLMLGICQASRLITWYPVPLRVFADGQERDGFLESVRNPQAGGRTAVRGAGEQKETSVTDFEMQRSEESVAASVEDCGASMEEKSEKEYFRVSSQVGEKEWMRMLVAANVQLGIVADQKSRSVRIAIAAVLCALAGGAARFFPGAAMIIYIMSFIGTVIFLVLLRNLLENPKRRIELQIRKGIAQNNVQGVWDTSVTELGIRQSISGKKSIMMPWESLVCVVETDTELIFYQKNKRQCCMIPKEGLESREQIESLKGLCRERQVEFLTGKQRKYVPNWFFPLLIFAVIAGFVAAVVRL